MAEIRECPFCGKTVATYEYTMNFKGPGVWGVRIVCEMEQGGCGAKGPAGHNKKTALAYWNNRTRTQRKREI